MPHIAGSANDLVTANAFLKLLQQSLGVNADEVPIFPAGSPESRNATLSIPTLDSPQAWIDIYYPVLNTPLNRSLQILGENGEPVWTADLRERVDPVEPVSSFADAVPTFHGLSREGEVEGKLVYAHYGRQEDFDALEENGQ
jgi:N-acetylated-alpha-linked acidic dipeptidase